MDVTVGFEMGLVGILVGMLVGRLVGSCGGFGGS